MTWHSPRMIQRPRHIPISGTAVQCFAVATEGLYTMGMLATRAAPMLISQNNHTFRRERKGPPLHMWQMFAEQCGLTSIPPVLPWSGTIESGTGPQECW